MTSTTSSIFSRFLAFLSVVSCFVGGTEVKALEAFKLCNKNPELNPMYVAIGYKSKPGNSYAIDEDDWISRGWWGIDFGDCETWYEVDGASYVYYYVSKANYTGTDQAPFCLRRGDKFNIAESSSSYDYFFNHDTAASSTTCVGLGSGYEYIDFARTKDLTDTGTYTLNLR